MKIRRKTNHGVIKTLPQNSIRIGNGWLVPIFGEFPDDLFLSYSDLEWEQVSQHNGLLNRDPTRFLHLR